MLEYRFATADDRPDILDFINLVFSMHSVPHDFVKLLPKVYAPEANLDAWHAIATENGRIKGCVALHPFSFRVAGHVLHGGYVGSVSVHPDERKRGVMARLMHMVIRHTEEEGLDFLALGGRRQRYEYYGFNACGSRCEYLVSRHNIQHALNNTESDNICFEPLSEDYCDKAYALYERQPVSGARNREQFISICRSFLRKPMAILRKGSFAGYLITNESGNNISECLTESPSLLPSIVAAWGNSQKNQEVTWTAMPWETAVQSCFSGFSEDYALHRDQMLQILHPVSFLQAMMDLKLSIASLSDGSLCFPLGEKKIEILVQDQHAHVSETSSSVAFTPNDRFMLLSLLGPDRLPTLPGCPVDWFPLPFAIPVADTF